MNQQIYRILLLLIICLSIPLAVNAQVTGLAVISGDGQTGRPGQTLKPFIVEARDQDGDLVIGVLVGFVPETRGSSLSNIVDTTGSDGRAQTTLTLPRRPGKTTVRAWVGDVRVTFEATAIALAPTTTANDTDGSTTAATADADEVGKNLR